MYKIIQRVFFLKLVANDLSDKRFLLTSKFCPLVPWGCLPLICGCTHLLNHEKMCIKSEVEEILFKLATNDHSDETFFVDIKFLALMGCVPRTLRLCLNFFSSITAEFNISSSLR